MKMKFLATVFMAASLFPVGYANAQTAEPNAPQTDKPVAAQTAKTTAEPSESEMQKAVVTKLQSLIANPDAKVAATSFKKDSCEVDKDKEGAYICTFTAAMDIKVKDAPEGNKKPIQAKGLFVKNSDGVWEATPMQ